MLQSLTKQVRECLRRADECAECASREPNSSLQHDFLKVEERWLKLALSYDFFDRLGLFTAHNDQKPTEFSQRLDQLSRVVGGSVADAPIEPSEAADEAAWASRLSSRELEVALLVARGLSNKEVARKLNVTDGTIKVHMHRIFKKSGTKSRYNLLLSKDASTLPEPEKVKDRPIKAQE